MKDEEARDLLARDPFGDYPCPCDRSSSTDPLEECPPSPGAHDEPPKKKQRRIKANRPQTRHRQHPANDEERLGLTRCKLLSLCPEMQQARHPGIHNTYQKPLPKQHPYQKPIPKQHQLQSNNNWWHSGSHQISSEHHQSCHNQLAGPSHHRANTVAGTMRVSCTLLTDIVPPGPRNRAKRWM